MRSRQSSLIQLTLLQMIDRTASAPGGVREP
jgi:hypothetical protein